MERVASDQFGYSVSLNSDGTIFAAGARYNTNNGPRSGHTRIFKWNQTNSSWEQRGSSIAGEVARDQSGYSVSISSDGTIVAIGAKENDGAGDTHSGHVRVFQWNSVNDSWEQLGSDINGEGEYDESGFPLSMGANGTIIAIGSRYNDDGGEDSGHVRVYEWDSSDNEWNQIGSNLDGDAVSDEFGRGISMSKDGSVFAAGAKNHDQNGSNSGLVKSYKINSAGSVSGPYTFNFSSIIENQVSKIFVPGGAIVDEYNTSSIISNTIEFTYDTTRPTMTITSRDISSNDKINKDFITLDFVASESIKSFDNSKIDISNASLSTITSSDNITFTGILTPTVNSGEILVNVDIEKFTDVVDNSNSEASNQFVWYYDNQPPTVTISSDDQESGVTSNATSIELKFTLSEEVESFTTENIDVTNGVLSSLSGSGTSYTATLKPISASTISVSVPAGSVKDSTGNTNESASNVFTWTFDSDQPIISITSDTILNGAKTTEEQITLFFTISDPTVTFATGNIKKSNAGYVSFAQYSSNPLVYKVIMRSKGEGITSSVRVLENKVTDSGGNGNIATEIFEWVYDQTLPTITIASDDMTSGDANSLSSINLTFTADEDINDFTITDINKTNCTLSDFTQVSSRIFTAKITPTNDGQILVYIPQGSVTDDAGNESNLTSTFEWNYDGNAPIILLTASEVVSGQYYDAQKINMTATITNESNLTLLASDFSVTVEQY